MGVRKELLRKVKNHIKDLEKRGIDVERVTRGKSLEKLAWNKNTYEKFINQKKNVLTRERDIKRRTNNQGYLLSEKEYKTVKKLERDFNKKKKSELDKYIKKFGQLNEVELAFLKGEPVRHLNSKENIELQTSFRKENLFDSFNGNIDLNFYQGFVKEQIKSFSYEDVIEKHREKFIDQITIWANANRLGVGDEKYKNRVIKELIDMYDNMGFIQAVQFNQDMEHKLQYVESASTNIYSSWDEKRLIEDLIKRQEDRDFVISN